MVFNMAEMIIFVGMQASGKSTYYKKYFADTHVRINLDMLNSKKAMNELMFACFENNISCVIDNTNPMKKTRKAFIDQAKAYNYKVICYSFFSDYETCLNRNNLREGKAKIPESGLRWWRDSFEEPSKDEGFDELNFIY